DHLRARRGRQGARLRRAVLGAPRPRFRRAARGAGRALGLLGPAGAGVRSARGAAPALGPRRGPGQDRAVLQARACGHPLGPPELYPWLKRTLTAALVKRRFKGICFGRVERHEVPNLWALNFLLHESLGGGGTVSLRLDAQGKTLSHALLAMEVTVPRGLVDAAARGDEADGSVRAGLQAKSTPATRAGA